MNFSEAPAPFLLPVGSEEEPVRNGICDTSEERITLFCLLQMPEEESNNQKRK